MVNARNPGRKHRNSGRDPGGFVALPWSVLDSAAYLSLSVHAKALLLEVARQYHGDDNGRMLLSRAYLAPRGWNSSDMIMKVKRELIAAGFIFETAKGWRPNKASWYAVTWCMLDKIPGYDFGAEQAFVRGAYRLKGPPKPLLKNASLRPPRGTEKTPIAPSHGTESPAAVPPRGAIRPISLAVSVPPHGHPLEVAISGDQSGGVPVGVDPPARPEKESAQPEKALGRWDVAKPTICQQAGCQTLTLGRGFCTKHRQTCGAQIVNPQ